MYTERKKIVSLLRKTKINQCRNLNEKEITDNKKFEKLNVILNEFFWNIVERLKNY